MNVPGCILQAPGPELVRVLEGADTGRTESAFDGHRTVSEVDELDFEDRARVANQTDGRGGWLFLETVATPGEATRGDEQEVVAPRAAVRFEEGTYPEYFRSYAGGVILPLSW